MVILSIPSNILLSNTEWLISSEGRCFFELSISRNLSAPIILESPVLSIIISSSFTTSSSVTLMKDSLSNASVKDLLKKDDNDSAPVSSSLSKLLGSISR